MSTSHVKGADFIRNYGLPSEANVFSCVRDGDIKTEFTYALSYSSNEVLANLDGCSAFSEAKTFDTVLAVGPGALNCLPWLKPGGTLVMLDCDPRILRVHALLAEMLRVSEPENVLNWLLGLDIPLQRPNDLPHECWALLQSIETLLPTDWAPNIVRASLKRIMGDPAMQSLDIAVLLPCRDVVKNRLIEQCNACDIQEKSLPSPWLSIPHLTELKCLFMENRLHFAHINVFDVDMWAVLGAKYVHSGATTWVHGSNVASVSKGVLFPSTLSGNCMIAEAIAQGLKPSDKSPVMFTWFQGMGPAEFKPHGVTLTSRSVAESFSERNYTFKNGTYAHHCLSVLSNPTFLPTDRIVSHDLGRFVWVRNQTALMVIVPSNGTSGWVGLRQIAEVMRGGTISYKPESWDLPFNKLPAAIADPIIGMRGLLKEPPDIIPFVWELDQKLPDMIKLWGALGSVERYQRVQDFMTQMCNYIPWEQYLEILDWVASDPKTQDLLPILVKQKVLPTDPTGTLNRFYWQVMGRDEAWPKTYLPEQREAIRTAIRKAGLAEHYDKDPIVSVPSSSEQIHS